MVEPNFRFRHFSSTTHRLLIIAVVGLVIRLGVAATFPSNFDLQSYAIVVDIAHDGGNVYSSTPRYNYTPIWLWLLLGLDVLHISPRIFLSFVDLLTGALIYLVAEQYRSGSGLKAFTFYWLNPSVILIVSYLGQFET